MDREFMIQLIVRAVDKVVNLSDKVQMHVDSQLIPRPI